MEKYLNLEGLEYLCQKMKTDLTRKQDQLTGQPGQVVGFDAAGSAIPQNLYTPEDAVTVPGGGAIEIDGSLGEGPYTFEYEEDGEGSAVQADQVSYDSGGSGLEAATVQGALDALSAVKADVSRVSNPNLLDNWYFADPVNQRGQAEYGRGYTIDRWSFGCDSEESKVMVGAGGIGLRSAENSGYNNLEQRIPKSRFLSGVYTLSFLVSNPSETKQVYIFGVDTVWDPQGALCSITAYVDCNALPDIVTIGLQKSISATPLTVIAAKLELGSQQTLAHQDAAGNWVLNDPPPDKTLELLKCQWYQQCAGFTRVAFGPIIAGHTVSSSIQIGKMRENPTCKLGLLDIPYQEHIAFDPAKMIFICTDRHNISVDISDMEIANRVAGKTVTIVDFFADANL